MPTGDITVKVRDGQVRKRPVYAAIGVALPINCRPRTSSGCRPATVTASNSGGSSHWTPASSTRASARSRVHSDRIAHIGPHRTTPVVCSAALKPSRPPAPRLPAGTPSISRASLRALVPVRGVVERGLDELHAVLGVTQHFLVGSGRFWKYFPARSVRTESSATWSDRLSSATPLRRHHGRPPGTAAHRDRVERYISHGRSSGARLTTGGGRFDECHDRLVPRTHRVGPTSTTAICFPARRSSGRC